MSSKDPVLIIEDSLAVGMLLSEFLKKLGYVDIHSATTGQEGVSLFKKINGLDPASIVFLKMDTPSCPVVAE